MQVPPQPPTPQAQTPPARLRLSKTGPEGTCNVVVLKTVPWDAQILELSREVSEAFGTSVQQTLCMWNKGMVLMQVSPAIKLPSSRVSIGSRGVSVEASDKPSVNCPERSHILNARFFILQPSRDYSRATPDQSRAFTAARRKWSTKGRQMPHQRQRGASKEELLALGRMMQECGGEQWVDLAVPLVPKRITEQQLHHCRRMYTQVFFAFESKAQADSAARKADGAVRDIGPLRMVLRLEPVAATTVAGAPRIPNPGFALDSVPPPPLLTDVDSEPDSGYDTGEDPEDMPQLLDSPLTPATEPSLLRRRVSFRSAVEMRVSKVQHADTTSRTNDVYGAEGRRSPVTF